jgi:hypothetical protein
MANQLIPPPEMDPPMYRHLTRQQRIEVWADLVDTANEFLMAGLRRKVGPGGDVVAAYREWYAREVEEHDAMIRQMAENFYRRGVRHGG